jgi:predicted transcriptional regulator
MTIMNIMADKKYLRRVKGNAGSFIYHPKIDERPTTGRMLKDLVDRAFDGSAAVAALNLLEAADVSEGELKQLRELIRRKGKGGGANDAKERAAGGGGHAPRVPKEQSP